MVTGKHEEALLNLLQDISVADPEQAGLGTTTPPEEPTQELETVEKGKETGTNDSRLPPPPTTVTIKTLFSHPDSHPVVLGMTLLMKYNAEWLEWEPETVQYRIMQDFGSLSDLNMSKIMAMKTLHVSDRFWEAWEVFVWCTMPFNGIFPDFDVMQVPTVAQCLVAVDIANRIRTDVQWSEEVELYLKQVHLFEGMLEPQAPLDKIVKMGPTEFQVKMEEVQQRWPDVRRTGVAPTAQTPEDEQLRRMLTAYEYLEASRERLRGQLPLVQHA